MQALEQAQSELPKKSKDLKASGSLHHISERSEEDQESKGHDDEESKSENSF